METIAFRGLLKSEVVNKKIGDHYEKQKVDRYYSGYIVFVIALLHITYDK